MQEAINILVIGKTGAGKSSLCNYIFNETVFATGTGRPVTGWNDNFVSHAVAYEHYILNVYDSVGIEANNLEKWKSRLDDFLMERAPSQDRPPGEWLHAAIYVVNAASSRIEKTELDLVMALSSSGIPVQVVLTNCDKCAADDLSKLKKEVEKAGAGIDITEVCSVSIRKRSGSTNSYGKEATLDTLVNGLDQRLKGRLVEFYCDNLEQSLIAARAEIKKKIKKSKVGLFNIIKGFIMEGEDFDMDKLLGFDVDNLFAGEAKAYEEMSESLESFAVNLGFGSHEESTSSKSILAIRERVDGAMDAAGDAVEKEFDRLTYDIDHGNGWEKTAAFGKILVIATNLKSFMILEMDKGFAASLKTLDQARHENMPA